MASSRSFALGPSGSVRFRPPVRDLLQEKGFTCAHYRPAEIKWLGERLVLERIEFCRYESWIE